MAEEISELYFKKDEDWRKWLHDNHESSQGVYLIFFKVTHENDSMRWEEAVKVALCYGWIDSTVKSLGDGKRKQYFTPRNHKSVWSALNKDLQREFDKNQIAFNNYQSFAPSYRKSYLYWLNHAKREATRQKRIKEIIELCANNKKSRSNW